MPDNMTCPKCGGLMELDEDNDIKKCPYCGYNEPVKTDDNTIIKLAKIYEKSSKRSNAERKQAEKEGRAFTQKQTFTIFMLIALIGILFIIIANIFL